MKNYKIEDLPFEAGTLLLTVRLLLWQKIGFQGFFSGADAALTVFAPTNGAFDAAVKALGNSKDDIFADAERLKEVRIHNFLVTMKLIKIWKL